MILCIKIGFNKLKKQVTFEQEIIHRIVLIAVENGKTFAYSMVFCKVLIIVLNNNEKQTL